MQIFDEIPDKVILLLSGGLDSASLFYLLCKYYPNVEVIPATGVVLQGLKDAECARNIVAEMRKRFSNIGEHFEYTVDLEDPYWVEKSEKMFEDRSHNSGSPVGLSKHLQQIEGLKNIREKTGVKIFMNATTANPPPDEIDFNHMSESRRDPYVVHKEVVETPYGGKVYSPYINKDKKFIAKIYEQEGLIDFLYPLTRSCIGPPDKTNNGEVECGECYWCHERMWAFSYLGVYNER